MVTLQTLPTLKPVPMLDFSREYAEIRELVLTAITEVCDSQKFILGPAVTRFEEAAARACGVPHGIGCASGTDALWLAMVSCGIGPAEAGRHDSAVVTTPFSFFATVSSILRTGATPILADIDPRTFNLSPESVREVLASNAKKAAPCRIDAVMPVHLYGQCADVPALKAVADVHHDVAIIEDAAQAFGATWEGTHAGALGMAAAFSFYPTKNLSAYGDAGLVTTANRQVDENGRMYRAHGMKVRYYHEAVGWNCRIDSIQAAVLEIKLQRVNAGNRRRQEIAALYQQLFTAAGLAAPANSTSTADGIVLPYVDPRGEHVFHQYVIRAPRRDALREHLTALRIGTEIYYPLSLHQQKALASLGYKTGDFPESERAAAEVLALPIYPEFREDEAETVVDAIRRFYQ